MTPDLLGTDVMIMLPEERLTDRLCDTVAWAFRGFHRHPVAPAWGRRVLSTFGRRSLLGLVLLAGLVAPSHQAAADPGGPLGTVVGVVRVHGSNQVLKGSRIEVLTDGSMVYSDSLGGYQLASLPAGPVELRVSRDGYAPMVLDVIVPAGGVLRVDVSLAPQQVPLIAKQTAVLAPVSVVSMAKIAIGSWADDLGHQYRTDQLLDGPFLTGEPDMFRMLGADPRMTLRPDGPPMLRAPGVDGGRMQVLLDGLPIWNTLHGGSPLSTVTPDAVSIVATHDGALPARFPGMMGDVLDVRTRDLTNDVTTARVAIGPVASRAMWGAPIQAGAMAGSVMLALRASHSSVFPRIGDGQPFVDRWVDGIGRVSLSNEHSSLELLAFSSGDRVTQTAPALRSMPLAMSPDVWADDPWPDPDAPSGGTGTTGSGTTYPNSGDGTTGGTSNGTGSTGNAAASTSRPGIPTIPWSSQTVGALWKQQLAPTMQLETRAWFSTATSGVHSGADTSVYSLPCAVDDALRHRGFSSTMTWHRTAIGASFDAFDTRYHVTNISWTVDSGAPLSFRTAPRIGALFAEQRWGSADDVMQLSAGLRATGIFGSAWYAEPRVGAMAHLGTRVTAVAGYSVTHQFVQSLRNDVSPLRALVGADFLVAAGSAGVPVSRTDAATAGVAARLTDHLTLNLDAYHRQLSDLALADPVNENLFAVSAFEIARAHVSGVGAALTGDHGLFQWHLSYGIARTAVTIANNTDFNAEPVVGRSAAASMAMAVTPSTRVQIAGWAATNQQAAQMTQTGYDESNWTAESGSTLSAWLPKYRRVDVTASHSYDVGQGHGTLSMFLTVANVFNNANVATYLRTRAGTSTSASAGSAGSVWQPVTLVPRSVQAGLSWQY